MRREMSRNGIAPSTEKVSTGIKLPNQKKTASSEDFYRFTLMCLNEERKEIKVDELYFFGWPFSMPFHTRKR